MYKKSEYGFTLIELILVILIIGLLVAIAIPAIFGLRREMREKQQTQTAEAALFIPTHAPATPPPPTSLPPTPSTSSTLPLPLSLSLTNAFPDPVYFGTCTGSEPSVITFEAEILGDAAALGQLVIWYTYFDSGGFPVMGDSIPMQVVSGNIYSASLDVDSNAAVALGDKAGTIQFFAQAQDGTGAMLAQSDGSQITVYYCNPPGITNIPPVKPPTLTPQPLPPPPQLACSDYTYSLDCENAGCYWWANSTCHEETDPCRKYDGDHNGCGSAGCSWDDKNSYCNTP